jgi:hypothetical protein
MKKIISFLLFVCILYACKKNNDPVRFNCCLNDIVEIFRIKDTAYFNYVTVVYDQAKNKIAAIPGPSSEFKACTPVKIDSGYYYQVSFTKIGMGCFFGYGYGVTAVTDVKFEDYKELFDDDTMYNHLLSINPYLECYQLENCCYITYNTSLSEDTALLNSWIRKGELGKYLKRLK